MKLKNNHINNIYIYRFCSYSWYGRLFIRTIKYFISRDLLRIKLKIRNKGSIRISKSIIGHNNILELMDNACLDGVSIIIQGSNNRIQIGKRTVIGKNCKILLYGNNLRLIIGNDCTFSHDDELLVQEDNSNIIIGNGCMFSHDINIRTSDAHPIYKLNTMERSNKANDIIIHDNVWISAYAIIQKGSEIGDGCIIGTCAITNKKIMCVDNGKEDKLATNCIIAGMPAKIVKTGVEWKRNFD